VAAARKATIGYWRRLALALTLATALPTLPAAAETVRLVTGNDFKPFSDQGLPQGGLATEIVTKALASQGVTLELDWQDWQRGYDAAKLLRYAGTFPYYTSKARAADFLYSQPLYSVKRRLFFRAGHAAPARVEDIAGGTVCRAQGYTPHAAVEALVQAGKVRLELPLDMTRCFELLALGRVDFVEADDLQGWESARITPQLAPGAVRATGFATEQSGLHVIVPKRLEGAERLIGLFNAGLAAITADGSYAAILRRHLGEPPGEPVAPAAGPASATSDLAGKAVDLIMQDGSRLKGTIAGLSEGAYRLRTAYGELTLPTAQVAELHAPEQVLAAAPAATAQRRADKEAQRQGSLRLTGAFAGTLVPALVEAFADSQGVQELEWQVGDPTRRVARFLAAPPGGLQAVEVVSLGAAETFKSLAAGAADAGLSERRIRPEELAATAGLGDLASEAGEQVVALDALVAVVHPGNPLHRLDRATLGRVLAGEIRSWQALGGPDTAIEVMSPSPRASSFQLVSELLLAGRPLARDARVLGSDAEIARMVAAFPGAIGLVRAAEAGAARPLVLDECGTSYDPADMFGIATEEYPLTRRIYLYGPPASPHPHLGGFVAFATAAAAQGVVAEAGFVGLEPRRQSDGEHGRLLAALDRYRPQVAATVAPYRDLVRAGRRLSPTFRFESGKGTLDPRAVRDVRRLASFVREQRIEPMRLVLAGFSDGRGGYQTNLALSRQRAGEVAAALAREGITVGAVQGVGEELPAACEGDEHGWARNRRVEVWVR
jgi:phosphate transport system substrate-binding protein